MTRRSLPALACLALALGGVICILIATGASYGLSGVMGAPYAFDPTINVLGLVFSAAIGILFGSRRVGRSGICRCSCTAQATPAWERSATPGLAPWWVCAQTGWPGRRNLPDLNGQRGQP